METNSALRKKLAKLMFIRKKEDTGTDAMDAPLKRAIREFQRYARMPFAGVLEGDDPDYAMRLRAAPKAQNEIFGLEADGDPNPETIEMMTLWETKGWFCPVVMQGYKKDGVKLTLSTPHENVWSGCEAMSSTGPNAVFVHATDVSRHFDAGDLRHVPVGQKLIYKEFCGPVSKPPDMTLSDLEIKPENFAETPFDRMSEGEKLAFRILRAVSEVECLGFFDSVNCYDGAIVSIGPAHWTLRSNAKLPTALGELPAFLSFVKSRIGTAPLPNAYERLIGFFGLEVDLDWGADGAALRTRQAKFETDMLHHAPTGDRGEANKPGFFKIPAGDSLLEYRGWHWAYRFEMTARRFPRFNRLMWDFARLRLRELLNTTWSAAASPKLRLSPVGIGPPAEPVRYKHIFRNEMAIALLLRRHIALPATVVEDDHESSTIRTLIANLKKDLPRLPLDPTQWNAQVQKLLASRLVPSTAPTLQQTLPQVKGWPVKKNWDDYRYTLPRGIPGDGLSMNPLTNDQIEKIYE